jgi:hypothetical protein
MGCGGWLQGKDWGPYCWCENVNYFGELGGFEMLFARFRQTSPLLPIPVYRKFCEAFSRVSPPLALARSLTRVQLRSINRARVVCCLLAGGQCARKAVVQSLVADPQNVSVRHVPHFRRQRTASARKGMGGTPHTSHLTAANHAMSCCAVRREACDCD